MSDSPERKPAPKPPSPHELNRQEMRASTLLPVIIPVAILLLGGLVWLITPDNFNNGLAIGISLSLLLFLLYWTRREPVKQRLLALLFAIPALIGVSVGLSLGRLTPILLGFGITGFLLVIYRALSIPLSYRFASRQFQAGRDEEALALVEKAITARPDFWESYQLKALIFLAQTDFPRAERAAKEAIAVNPRADAAYHTLGQVYLIQAQFTAAADAYIQAAELNPDHALHWYYLGLCQVREGELDTAVDSLTAATKRAPRILEYELLQHYYLWRCLDQLDRPEAAAVHEKMQNFSPGLPPLQAQAANLPPTPHTDLYLADLEDLARQLAT